jgi:ribonuclease HIII
MVDDNVLIDLSKLNIRDSKDLSDSQNIDMGETILEICKDKCYVLATMPEKYNELMEGTSFQSNSQKLLAWQHRRALENILQKYECAYAICDQFGPEYLIKEGLKTGKGQNITIIQRPKAEKDIAVAAASILARREFLLRLHKMSAEYKVVFPKGSSDLKSIFSVAEGLIRSYGRDVLRKTAKLHFKTTKHILDKLSNE